MRVLPWSRLPTLLGSDAYCYIYRERRRYIATQKSFLLVVTHLRARLSRVMSIYRARDRLPARPFDLPNYYVADLRLMMIDIPLVCRDTICA